MSPFNNCARCGCPGVERGFVCCGRCNVVLLHQAQRCIHCRGPVDSGRVCPSCAVLLAELGEDSTTERTEEPRKGSGDPDLPCQSVPSVVNPSPEPNGYWLYHDARRAGDLDQVIAFGREH